ncbi:hypothetical protein LSAT2_009681 [Lamellibrachia satsuma]|nr:hypothetical protein LSAT2_012911 [Lamellibrachia satsuma]KAI0242981.1 hypothetical protein LSAT2_009681 [Lamellibrachia satsuma]
MTFPEVAAPLRTDAQFDEMTDEDHHTGSPPFGGLSVGMAMYYIVEFVESDPKEIELVPECWLTESGGCFWPPFKQITKAIKTCQSPDGNWQVYRVRKLCTASTYEIGRNKLPEAEYTSDLHSSDGTELLQKRKKRPTARYVTLPLSDDESIETQNIFNLSSQELVWNTSQHDDPVIPVPYHNHTFAPLQSTRIPTSTPRSSTPANTTPRMTTPVQGTSTCSTPIPSTSRALPTHSTHPSTSQQAPASSGSMTTLRSCAVSPFELALVAVMERLVQQVEHNGCMIAQNNVLLQQLAVRGDTNTTNTSTDLPTGITLPITSLEDLQAVETILQDKAAIKQMIGALSFIGGITTVDTVRRMMSYVMTNATAKSCNWRGKNDKVAFSRLKLWDVVCGAVRRNPCTRDAKNTDVECTLKQWLRFAADRDGGRQQREQRRRQQLQHI